VTTDKIQSPAVIMIPSGSSGWTRSGLTANLTADVTLNTDFAQVEVESSKST
jgi:hypothetical protein